MLQQPEIRLCGLNCIAFAIAYTTEVIDGKSPIDVRDEDDTIWNFPDMRLSI